MKGFDAHTSYLRRQGVVREKLSELQKLINKRDVKLIEGFFADNLNSCKETCKNNFNI